MPRMTAGKRSEPESFWRAHLEGWRRSDLNQREYCELHGPSSALMHAYNRYNDLYAQGRYEEALPFAERALKLAEQEFGPNDPSTAIDLNNLVALYYM